MYWFILILAGVCECAFTTCLKLSEGLTKVWWAVAFLVLSAVSFGLLTIAAQRISLGTAYAVWTGIGAFGTAVIGIIWFKDPATFWRVFFLCGMIGCMIGLKLASPDAAE
ncbi:cation transporter : Small multidrug resistance protein OS=Spirosoma linguale (strain ATCC 33905 / DSM 74 / LMG 10896) GN=Slin_3424 PE=3 SV=1: Multi_Drug_Res [Gemmataceae bacterium]|nr:cation transporter : Small multidrug resistance protein OS=Spirosoma linguale (strain ATCC 33905 / DSM 74 / LMG 10896) GN=Slin_3424 PE=3 SV=1: Multi_Drug_Res [Gemmataceae bacterium]VTU01296.1 cation transporter : Small multidrug resistance protein OS=Spirosoma linguale (strain ATCC 33905 / DSM 74 / LMG 10896) GN=Slin_3424 PE=3 SV=1: Multi_Drug_Res [Gemmataceae bacterium]